MSTEHHRIAAFRAGPALLWLCLGVLPAMPVVAEAPTEQELQELERQTQQLEREQAEEKKRAAAAEAQRQQEEQARQLAAEQAQQQSAQGATLPAPETGSTDGAEKNGPPVRAGRLKAGDIFQDTLADGSKGPEMVVIPAGQFQMGDLAGDGKSAERPVHTVTMAQPFAMGKYEVTFAGYDKFAMGTGRTLPLDHDWGRGNRPVINVSWDDAVAFAAWLSQQTGKHYRLPSEAEWEYAARAGTTTSYWWGDTASKDRAKFGSLLSGTAPVGTFPPNPFGLHDTSGNVWEWTQDCWNESYVGAPEDGSAWISGDCSKHVLRGGSWFIMKEWLRSAFRYTYPSDERHGWLGFRLVRDLDSD